MTPKILWEDLWETKSCQDRCVGSRLLRSVASKQAHRALAAVIYSSFSLLFVTINKLNTWEEHSRNISLVIIFSGCIGPCVLEYSHILSPPHQNKRLDKQGTSELLGQTDQSSARSSSWIVYMPC